MRECVQFDVVGDIHLDFDDESLEHVATGYAAIQLPRKLHGLRITINAPLPYHEIQWIGAFRKRQMWLLIPGILFTLMLPVWAIAYFGNWGPFACSVVWCSVLGIFPLALFARGRSYLGIATAERIIIVPMERQRRKIARILGLLSQAPLTREVSWQLEGTRFSDPTHWDLRPASGKGFNKLRYALITSLIGAYGAINLIVTMSPHLRASGLLIAADVAAGLIAAWIIVRLYRRTRSRNAEEGQRPL